MSDIQKRLKEIRARADAATPGPWEPFDSGPWGGLGAGVAIGKDVENWVVFGKHTTEPHVANSFFTAHAREDIPWLLSLVETLTKVSSAVEKETK